MLQVKACNLQCLICDESIKIFDDLFILPFSSMFETKHCTCETFNCLNKNENLIFCQSMCEWCHQG